MASGQPGLGQQSPARPVGRSEQGGQRPTGSCRCCATRGQVGHPLSRAALVLARAGLVLGQQDRPRTGHETKTSGLTGNGERPAIGFGKVIAKSKSVVVGAYHEIHARFLEGFEREHVFHAGVAEVAAFSARQGVVIRHPTLTFAEIAKIIGKIRVLPGDPER